jgi:aspartyl-tRNA(Asn)/glutamyl-tRNA(Gln) amidotransferase subunit A
LNDVKDPIQMYLQDIFTVHANLTGNPAISLPLGTSSEGLPFGVQVMTAPFSESLLYGFSAQLEELVS